MSNSYVTEGCAQLITQTRTQAGTFDTVWRDSLAPASTGTYTLIAHFRWDADDVGPDSEMTFCAAQPAENCSRVDVALARLVEVREAEATSTTLPRGVVLAANAMCGAGLGAVVCLFVFFYVHRRSPVVLLSDAFSSCLVAIGGVILYLCLPWFAQPVGSDSGDGCVALVVAVSTGYVLVHVTIAFKVWRIWTFVKHPFRKVM